MHEIENKVPLQTKMTLGAAKQFLKSWNNLTANGMFDEICDCIVHV